MWRTPATLRGHARRRAGRPRRRALILALETSCDDTCAAVVTRAGEIRSNVVSSQGVHERYGGVVPEIASRHHLELVNAVVDDALGARGRDARRRRADRRHAGPRAGRARCSSASRRPRGSPPRGGCRSRPVDHLQGHVAATYLEPEPIEPPFLCLLASGGHTLLARVTEPRRLRGARPARSTTPRARRSTRARGCSASAYPGGPALSKLRRAGDPAAFAFPTAARVAGLDFSFAGLKTALLYAVRDLGEEETRAPRRRPRGLLRARDRRGADRCASSARCAAEPGARLALGGGVAANRAAARARRGRSA